MTLDLHFWRGFEKRAEVLADFSGDENDRCSELKSHHPLTSMMFRTDDGPDLGKRSVTTAGPRLDALTISDRQHPTGGMA